MTARTHLADLIRMWTDYTNSQPLWFLHISYRNPESRINVHFLLNSLKITFKTFYTPNGETQSALQRKQRSQDLWYVYPKKREIQKYYSLTHFQSTSTIINFRPSHVYWSSHLTSWVKIMRNLCDLSLPFLTII